MGLFMAAVRLVADLIQLSGIVYILIAVLALMVLTVAYNTFTPNR